MADPIAVKPEERLVQSVSTPELERRWTAAREMMSEHHLDYLVMQNQEEFWEARLVGSPTSPLATNTP